MLLWPQGASPIGSAVRQSHDRDNGVLRSSVASGDAHKACLSHTVVQRHLHVKVQSLGRFPHACNAPAACHCSDRNLPCAMLCRDAGVQPALCRNLRPSGSSVRWQAHSLADGFCLVKSRTGTWRAGCTASRRSRRRSGSGRATRASAATRPAPTRRSPASTRSRCPRRRAAPPRARTPPTPAPARRFRCRPPQRCAPPLCRGVVLAHTHELTVKGYCKCVHVHGRQAPVLLSWCVVVHRACMVPLLPSGNELE